MKQINKDNIKVGDVIYLRARAETGKDEYKTVYETFDVWGVDEKKLLVSDRSFTPKVKIISKDLNFYG